MLDHERGKMSESSTLANQGDQTLMNFTSAKVVRPSVLCMLSDPYSTLTWHMIQFLGATIGGGRVLETKLLNNTHSVFGRHGPIG